MGVKVDLGTITMSNRLDLTIDLQNRRLVKSFDANVGVSLPSFYQGDTQDIFLRFVNPTGRTDIPFTEVDPTGWTVKLGIGTIGAAPTSGTFTLTYGANTTTGIAYNAAAATVENAVDALASVVSAGGVTVSGNAGGPWNIAFNSVGTRTDISGVGTSLAPISQVVQSGIQTGSATLSSIQQISLVQNPIAFQDTWSDASVASINVTSLQTGSGTQSSVQKIALSDGVYGGAFTVQFGSVTSESIPYNADGAAVQAALEAMSSIGSGNISVSGNSGGPWICTFQGTKANAAQSAFSGAAGGLISPKGKLASLALNTGGIEQAIGSATSISATFEIEITPSGSNRQTALQTTCSIVNDLIVGAPSIPTPGTTYYSTVESDQAYIQNRSTLTGVTGGGALNLDGLVTTGVGVGVLAALTVATGTTLYQLKSGTDAESGDDIIRPDDYDGTTNAKVWKRVQVYGAGGGAGTIAGQFYGSNVVTAASYFNFTGDGVTVTGSGATLFINVASSAGGTVVAGQNNGSNVVTNATAFNFTGAGVTVTAGGSVVNVDISATGGGGSVAGQLDGVNVVTVASYINFTGNGVTVTGNGSTLFVNIPSGAASAVVAGQLDGVNVVTNASAFNFSGAGISVTASGSVVNVAMTSTGTQPQVKKDAANVVTACSIFNFTGAGVTVTANGNTAFINISATGSGSSAQLVTVATGATTITAGADGQVFTNTGATTLVQLTLPSAASGLRINFLNQNGYGIKPIAASGDTIRLGSVVSVSSGYISSTVTGASAELVAINSTEWLAKYVLETWQVQTS